MQRNPLHTFLALAVLLAGAPAVGRAQLHPTEITLEQSRALPYRESGKLSVTFNGRDYTGSATYIHRYTGLTAGHLLYDGDGGGFADSVHLLPNYYKFPLLPMQDIAYFAVLSGYQDEASVDQDSSEAFARDMGYFVLVDPAIRNEWASLSADPSLLTMSRDFLILGYAAESFKGDQLASVEPSTPYTVDLPGFYNNTGYYTEGGMSGGPVYITQDGHRLIAAINVAGSVSGDPVLSGARAVTEEVRPLLVDAEYEQGMATGGVISGPSEVAAGDTVTYRTGVTFVDGQTEGAAGLHRRYDEIQLIPKGARQHDVIVEKFRPERFHVTFPASLPTGTRVVLRMLRDTRRPRAQTPLQTLTVTIQ